VLKVVTNSDHYVMEKMSTQPIPGPSVAVLGLTRASGKPWPQYLQKTIFARLQL